MTTTATDQEQGGGRLRRSLGFRDLIRLGAGLVILAVQGARGWG